MPNVVKTPLQFDFKKLASEVTEFTKNHYFHSETGQLCLTHPVKCEDPLYYGVGSLVNAEKTGLRCHERDFTEFYHELRGSYLEQVYREVKAWSPYPVGRLRIIEMSTRKCLSYHVDLDIRYHLAIQTNPHALMFFGQDVHSPYHIPADGALYRTNTLAHHTAMNAHSTEYRYHLVFSAFAEDEQYNKFEW